MFNFKENSIILIVSDLHLGAFQSKHKEFKEFLGEIKTKMLRNELSKLKVLIILGDFFDVMMDSYRDLIRDYSDIYKLLDFINKELQKKEGSILFTLGNHEIPLISKYESHFKWRKRKFVRNFTKRGFKWKFLKKKNVCQYILLNKVKKKKSWKWRLSLYNKKKKIARKKRPFREIFIPLEEIPSNLINQKYNCLIIHGYQFDNHFNIFKYFWAISLKCSDLIKEIINFVWNGIYRRIFPRQLNIEDIDETTIHTEVLNQKGEIEKIFNTKLKKRRVKKIEKIIFSFKEGQPKFEKDQAENGNQRFYNEIFEKFLPSLEKLGYNEKISHIIFGHSHMEDINEQNNVLIVNSGAWHQVETLSFVEIGTDGVPELKTIKI